MPVRIGVATEARRGETRVALIPESVRRLLRSGGDSEAGEPPITVTVEAGAGERAFAADQAYRDAGAEIATDADAVWTGADLLVCVNPPAPEQAERLPEGSALLGMLNPTQSRDLMQVCQRRRITALAFEAVPRNTRAQKIDALSSMSTVAGYRATLLAAEACPKFFPMLMTAAGTATPARVLVIGAGVAGLQAIATARRLGAIVEAYDVRAAAKEQVLSLGAKFVELPETEDAETAGGYAKEQSAEQQRRQRELLAERLAEADVVITTALVPGKPAPRIIDEDNFSSLRFGGVIVDLAAEAGGNCSLTKPGETVENNGVQILGPINLPAGLPVHASQMYSRNVAAFLGDLIDDGRLNLDMNDEVIRGCAITHEGEVLHEPTREALGLAPLQETNAEAS